MANLKDISTIVSEKMGITKKDAEAAVRTTFEAISEKIKVEEVSIANFGKFEVTERSARQGRNPQTGETISIPASKTTKFKASKYLKDIVNS